MDVGEMEGNEPQVKFCLIPTTPVKPRLQKPLPICTPGEENQPNGEAACSELSAGAGKICGQQDHSEPSAKEANAAGDNANICLHAALEDDVSRNPDFDKFVALAYAASAHYNAARGNEGKLKNLFNPILESRLMGTNPLFSLHQHSLEQCSCSNPQSTSYNACSEKNTFQVAPPTPDSANREEGRQVTAMQIHMEEKNQGEEEENIPTKRIYNNGTPNNRELSEAVAQSNKTPQQKPKRRKHRPKVIIEGKPKRTRKPAIPKPTQSKENPTGKRKYVRRKGLNKTSTPPTVVTGGLDKIMIPESAQKSCRRSLSFEIGARDESSACRENAAVHLGKDTGVVVEKTDADLAHDLNTHTQVLTTSLPEIIPLGENPKDGPTAKRKYVRRKRFNKTSTVLTEVTEESMMPQSAQESCRRSLNSDIGARVESSACRENAAVNVHLGKEIGVVAEKTDLGLAHDLKTYMQGSATSLSKGNPLGEKPKERPTRKRKSVRRKGPNNTSPTDMTKEFTEPMMLESAKMSCIRSINFDIGAADESSVYRENSSLHLGEALGMEEMHQGFAYDQNTSMQHALNHYMSLHKNTKAPRKSISKCNPPGEKPKEKPTGTRKYVRRRKGGNNNCTPPMEVAEELTEPMMPKTAKMSFTGSLSIDAGARDESSAWKENSAVHLHKEIGVVEEMRGSLAYDLSTFKKQGEHENRANPNDFNSNDSPISTTGLQMVGSKRKHSNPIRSAETRCENLIGAQYNELLVYKTKCWVPKKRRSGKGKTTNSSTTSSVTVITTKNVQPATCTQKDTLAYCHASSFSCSISGSEYYAARVPAICEATKSAIHDNPQTFEYISSLGQTRLLERSRDPIQISHHASITGIRNSDTKPSHTIKLGISGRQTFGGQERAETCIDALVAEMPTSLTKKKRNKKESALFSSVYSSTNENQQHRNFVLGNYHLPWGKSSDVAHEVLWRHWLTVDALAEKFKCLNINTESRGPAFHQQNALVPYQKQNSLVQGVGTIIPFQDPKKQPVRPKVDLDEETNRVWKLLMLDINSHGIDGMDEDKAKWWEEERNVFRGRADSFIARMHLVQGDRRFSQWKGSVVDSVVGVFLTQNVSDHLSSSAFMSLAARFPLKSSSKCKTYHEESTNLLGNKPQVHIVEPEENKNWDEKILNQSVHEQSSMTIDIVQHFEEKEAVNRNNSCRTSSSVISLTDESNCRNLESAERNISERQIPMKSGPISTSTEEGLDKSCYHGVRKELYDLVSSQSSVISSQISGDCAIDQMPDKIGSCSDSNSEVEVMSSTAKYNLFCNRTSFSKLLEMADSTTLHEVNSQTSKTENLEQTNVVGSFLEAASIIPSHERTLELTPSSGVLEVQCFDPFKAEASSSGILKDKYENYMNRPSSQTAESAGRFATTHSQSMVSQLHPQEQSNQMQQNLFSISRTTQDFVQKARELDLGEHKDTLSTETIEINSAPIKLKCKMQGKEKKDDFNWDRLRIKAQAKGKREKTENTMDSLDWDAVRCADVSETANAIKERGMNNRLAERIKNFLNRLVEEHGSIDLEWLRNVPPDQAKEYLLSIRGLGLKSVECVRLLTLHHLAFPVDTNVGRIAVRLGWVPLQPLPESLQLHLLELYPILESIQKYLWPRLCKLDQRTLYELHYQMITFGKVFCTKSKPNCNACPMRGECRHFASAFASARLALPGPEQKRIVSTTVSNEPELNPSVIISQLPLLLPENTNQAEGIQQTEVSRQMEPKSEINICQPIIEEPSTPEPECCSQVLQNDIEDAFCDDSCEIPTIKLNFEEFTLTLQNYLQENMELQEGEMSKALVALNPETASIPMPKLKNVSRLRTEHCVYELPDSHCLLEGWDKREPDDPGKYLLAIWTPGETANSVQPPESKCSCKESGHLCDEKECFSCNSFREAESQIVRGTLLIPCRTAMRGSFPLNGTYFQVNEVFADHGSSLNPISVPRSLIWNLNRRTVYFGTSIPTIFKGLSTPEIQQCFWRGYVCVRGFDRETGAPRPLIARLHFPASKLPKTPEKTKEESTSANSQGLKPKKTKKESTSAKSQGLKPNSEHLGLQSIILNLQQRGEA